MPAYLLANIEVTDPAGFERYRAAVPAVIARHGGRYLARGGASEVLEGAYSGHRFVVLEFPDRAAAEAFWQSPDYAECRKLREGAAIMNVAIVEGIQP
jgi:uncharacterized protein (DUF1330 family)